MTDNQGNKSFSQVEWVTRLEIFRRFGKMSPSNGINLVIPAQCEAGDHHDHPSCEGGYSLEEIKRIAAVLRGKMLWIALTRTSQRWEAAVWIPWENIISDPESGCAYLRRWLQSHPLRRFFLRLLLGDNAWRELADTIGWDILLDIPKLK